MIIYLDSADLDQLDRLAQKEPVEFADFVAKWNEIGCELGLSFHHAQEIAQLSDSDSIERRIEVIKSFATIRFAGFGSLRAMELEIDTQLAAAIGNTEPDFSRLQGKLFPIANVTDFAELVREAEAGVKDLHGLLKNVADASTFMGKGMAELRVQMVEEGRSWPAQPESDFDWDSGLESFLAAQEETGVSRNDIESLRRLLRTQIPFFKVEGGLRHGIQAMYGLKGIAIVDDVAMENFEEVAGYFGVARSRAMELAALLELDPAMLQSMVPNLNPFDAPGMRLKLAVERARRKATPTENASDYIDEEHLPFLAHSDVAFVDKRTHHYANTAVGSSIGDLPAGSVTHLYRGGTVERVMRVIRQGR